MLKKIKIGLHVIALSGLILTVGNELGWFVKQERLDLYRALMNEPYSVESKHPGVASFLVNFYDPNKANIELKQVSIVGLRSSGIIIGNNKPMAGSIHLWLDGDRQSTWRGRLLLHYSP